MYKPGSVCGVPNDIHVGDVGFLIKEDASARSCTQVEKAIRRDDSVEEHHTVFIQFYVSIFFFSCWALCVRGALFYTEIEGNVGRPGPKVRETI